MKKVLSLALVLAILVTSCVTALVFASAEGELVNLALGKSYEMSPQFRQGGADVGWGWDENAPISYPDEGGTLTDGVYSTLDPAVYTDPAWVGFSTNTPDYGEYGYINVDLEAVSDISKVVLYLGRDSGVGIGVPYYVSVWSSEDGVTYDTFCCELAIDSEAAVSGLNIYTLEKEISAQYVQVRLYHGGWAFISEVELLGVAPQAPVDPGTPDEPASPATESIDLIPDAVEDWVKIDVGEATVEIIYNEDGSVSFVNDDLWTWPSVETWYSTPITVAVEDCTLVYDFTVTGEAATTNINFFFEGGSFTICNDLLDNPNYDSGSGDLKPGTYQGEMAFADLVNATSLLGKAFPAEAVVDGKLTLNGINVFAVNDATVVINELKLVVPAEEPETPAVEWSEEDALKCEGTNIATGKEWTGNKEESVSTYQGNLTDGIVGTPNLKYDGTDPWYGWDSRLLTETEGVATAIIDLGEVVSNITSVGAHVWLTDTSGILAPEKIVYSASLDGVNYEVVGEITEFAESGVAWETVYFEKYLSARYIKFEFTCVGTFTFVSELAVNVPRTIKLDNVGYKHAATISLVAGGGQTVAEIAKRGHGEEKDMNYAYLVIVDRDGKVVATNTGMQVPKSDVVCPEGGYIISYNCNVAGYDVVKEIKIGATVVLHGVSKADMAFARTQDGISTLEDAYVTWDNSTALGSIAISHVNAYTWGVYNEMIITGEGQNCMTALGYDCTYWIAIKVDLVDGVYTVTEIEGNGETKDMTASADGFIVYCFGNDAASYAAAGKVVVGDVLLVSTIDWTAGILSSETPLGELVFGAAGALDATTPAADIDGDGAFTAADSTAMLQYLAGIIELPEGTDADLDGNGAVDIYDSVLIQQYAAGMIVEFPAE